MYAFPHEFQNRAYWLGYIGLVPLGIGALLLATQQNSPVILDAIRNYAAIILTFVGAIHWGRALNSGNRFLMTCSVAPSLLAWLCLFLPSSIGLPLLSAAFLIQWLFDVREYQQFGWFVRLRTQLTLFVCTLLLYSWAQTVLE